jgi:hypothetical protein
LARGGVRGIGLQLQGFNHGVWTFTDSELYGAVEELTQLEGLLQLEFPVAWERKGYRQCGKGGKREGCKI